MRHLRVLLINPVGQLGGAERCLLTMIQAIGATDPSIEMHALACGDGPLLERMRQAGAIVHCLPFPEALAGIGESGLGGRARFKAAGAMAGRALLGWTEGRDYPRRFRSMIEDISPDLIHSNGIKTHLLTGWLGRVGCPILWHIHDLLGERALAPRLLGPVVEQVAGAIAISQAVAADLRQVLPALPVEVILNAVDTAHFAPGSADGRLLDRLAGLSPAAEDVVRIGQIATYARWKGQDIFLKAAARVLQRTNPNAVRFYIIGGPIYDTQRSQFSRQELESRAAALGIADQIGFIDFQQSTVPVNRALDVVVHASTRAEPFGLTIAEAMACGRAVIVSAAGGAAELFKNEWDGLGVAPGDPAELADAILRLMTDAPLRKAMGERARDTAEAKFNTQRYGRQLCHLYERCARGGMAAAIDHR